MRKMLIAIAITLCYAPSFGQQTGNFTFSPEKPRPGDLVKFSYLPAGDLTGKLQVPELIITQMGIKNKVYEVKLTKSRGKLIGEVKTDSTANFLFFDFHIAEVYDNNNLNGYTVTLFNGNKPAPGANKSRADFYLSYIKTVGGTPDKIKAVKALEEEMVLYPAKKEEIYLSYLKLKEKDDALKLALREIEKMFKTTLKTEDEYQYLQNLYNAVLLPEQANFFEGLRKQRFPNGSWKITEALSQYKSEGNANRKEVLLKQILHQINADPLWKRYEKNRGDYIQELAVAYSSANRHEDFKRILNTYFDPKKDQENLIAAYQNAAANSYDDSTQLPFIEEYAARTYHAVKGGSKNATIKKPDDVTQAKWAGRLDNAYMYYGYLYADILYRQKKYKEAFPVIEDIVVNYQKGQYETVNEMYAITGYAVKPDKVLKKRLEAFVEQGKANALVKEILLKFYVAANKSETGFEDYLTVLKHGNTLQIVEELKKTILNEEQAPSFSLKNVQGETVDLNALKGKIVVLDFWATWCGPCVASFPNMQKAVNKYKNDKDVIFLFINTWEKSDDKTKNAGDFIAKNKYNFNVAIDANDEVVKAYKITGIPSKFVINKEGKITFNKKGGGTSDSFLDELIVMIELAKNPAKVF